MLALRALEVSELPASELAAWQGPELGRTWVPAGSAGERLPASLEQQRERGPALRLRVARL